MTNYDNLMEKIASSMDKIADAYREIAEVRDTLEDMSARAINEKTKKDLEFLRKTFGFNDGIEEE